MTSWRGQGISQVTTEATGYGAAIGSERVRAPGSGGGRLLGGAGNTTGQWCEEREENINGVGGGGEVQRGIFKHSDLPGCRAAVSTSTLFPVGKSPAFPLLLGGPVLGLSKAPGDHLK